MIYYEKIKEMIEKKGLTVDCFDEMNEIVETLEKDINRFKEISETFNKRFESHIEYEGSRPFNNWDVKDLEERFNRTKEKLIENIYSTVHSKFPSIKFNANDFDEFLKTQEKFNARAIMFYLFETYGEDEELIRIAQIQQNLKEWRSFSHTGKKGIKFDVSMSWRDEIYETRIPRVKEFADIIFDKVQPTLTTGIGDKHAGCSYEYNHFKITFYKKGSATMNFDTVDDYNTFMNALNSEPEEILVKMEA